MHGYFFLLLAALFLSACSDTSRSDTPTESKVIVEPLDSSQPKVTDSVEPEIPPPPEDVYASYRQAFSHYYHREGWASCPPWLGGIANIDVNHFTVYIVGDLEAGRDSLEKRLQRSDFQVKLARFSFGHLIASGIFSMSVKTVPRSERKRATMELVLMREKTGLMLR